MKLASSANEACFVGQRSLLRFWDKLCVSQFLHRCYMEEAGEAAAEATILVIDIGIEDTDGWGERDEVVVSDGGWNEAAVAFA